MPCYDERSSADYQAKHYWKPELDKLTRMLCTVLTFMRPEELKKQSNEVQEWWAEHQAWDRRRLAKEAEEVRERALRTKALKKLSAEEKKALRL